MKPTLSAHIGGDDRALRLDVDALRPDTRPLWTGDELADLLGRAVVVVLFSLFALRFASDFLATGRITGLLLLTSELLVVVLTVARRSTTTIDRSHRARLLTAFSMLGPLLLRPAHVVALAPEVITALFSAAGLIVVIGGKLSLGRSFGLMPANRGVVSGGLYRLVRHPIYMGYLVTHVGFIAANPTIWNIVLVVTADLALMRRAVCEEQTLSKDAAYCAYQQIVRWRVLPGVF